MTYLVRLKDIPHLYNKAVVTDIPDYANKSMNEIDQIFGRLNHCRVVEDSNTKLLIKQHYIEFDSEAAYTMFVLKWS